MYINNVPYACNLPTIVRKATLLDNRRGTLRCKTAQWSSASSTERTVKRLPKYVKKTWPLNSLWKEHKICRAIQEVNVIGTVLVFSRYNGSVIKAMYRDKTAQQPASRTYCGRVSHEVCNACKWRRSPDYKGIHRQSCSSCIRGINDLFLGNPATTFCSWEYQKLRC